VRECFYSNVKTILGEEGRFKGHCVI
jgi:hypothetical protein